VRLRGEAAFRHSPVEGRRVGSDHRRVEPQESTRGDRTWAQSTTDGVEGVAQAVPGTGFVALGPEQGQQPLPAAAEIAANRQHGQHRVGASLGQGRCRTARAVVQGEASQHPQAVHADLSLSQRVRPNPAKVASARQGPVRRRDAAATTRRRFRDGGFSAWSLRDRPSGPVGHHREAVMTRRAILGPVFVSAAVIVASSGCARGFTSAGDPAPVERGRAVQLQVSNTSGGPMEVYAAGSGTTYRVGTVHPGLSERFVVRQGVVLDGSVEFVARSAEGRIVRSGPMLLRSGDVVDFALTPHGATSTSTVRAWRSPPPY
jgi:hypothetical protein